MITTSCRVVPLSAILLAAMFAMTMSTSVTATNVTINSFLGAWSSSTTYSPGNVVTHSGASYICLVGNKDVKPGTNSADWAILDARGATGPAGPGAVLVKDSNGIIVGSYMLANPAPGQGQPPTDYVFITAFSTPFAITFTNSQLGAPAQSYTNVLWFTSSDCSGTPYYFFGGATQVTAVPIAGVGGTIAYVLGTPGSSLTANSSLTLIPGSANGACQVTSNSNYYFPVVATYNLSTLGLVPPFSVQ
jgi:hypothetical protein